MKNHWHLKPGLWGKNEGLTVLPLIYVNVYRNCDDWPVDLGQNFLENPTAKTPALDNDLYGKI